MDKDLVLVVFAKILVPFILLFALYVQFHGDFGPGGGFQAGVIFATGLILYALVQGVDRAMAVMPPAVLKPMMALGVLVYGGVGVASMLLGGHFLDYGFLAHDPLHGQHYGILIIELGVGITVAAVMMVIFYAFIGERD
jgi:multicomponent Na+:H+ antiporter subunit B